MNYLITGGTGFLGTYVAKQLLERGDKVVCFSRSKPSANSMSEILSKEQIDALVYAEGDITDVISLVHVCQAEKIDVIFHPAGLLLADCNKNPIKGVQTNILGTLNVFEAAKICGIKRVVWASSNSAIGTASHLPYEYVPNDAPHHPVTIYGKIKDLNEFMGEFYYQNYGLECIGLRYTVIYGKGRRRGGANYIKYTLNDPALGIPSVVDNATDTPNFVYVEDAARATILACDMPYKRAAYNVTGQFIPMMDLVDYVRKLIPDAQITTVPGEMDLAWKFDTTVEEEELGYKPSVDIYEGALITINDVREGAGLPPITVK